jgi:tRNA1Val (adenine37-N6)-methyltransferase
MPNPFFRFKQFTIQQDRCAMKVSTDACLQGAWTPIAENVTSVLDIGAGTGLLSLMLAQRSDRIHVDAIEIDEDASLQAQTNAASSPWSNRVHVINGDATKYLYSKQYDLVICNPPFFNDSLLSDSDSRNLARHTVSLSYSDLWKVLDQVLKPDGYASIMLPVVEHTHWESLLNTNDWHINHRLCIHHRANSSCKRIISLCSRNATEKPIEEKLFIYSAPNHYSTETSELLKPFYLRFKTA